jgi:chitinase
VYQADIKLTNISGTELNGWTAEFVLNDGQTLNSLWGAVKSPQSTASKIIVSNPTFSGGGKLAPGASVTLGMTVKKTSGTAGIKSSMGKSTPETVPAPVAPGIATPFVAPTNPVAVTQSKYKVIGYFPNWLIYPRANNTKFPKQNENRPKFTPADIDVMASKLTHIYYAFAKPYTLGADPDIFANMDPATDNFCNIKFNNEYWNSGIKSYKVSIVDPWCDTCIPMQYQGNTYIGHFATLRALKAKYPGLKTIISIGGWTIYNQGTPAAKFSTMVASAATRKEFIDSTILFAKKYGFDGADIDFEYPGYAPNGGKPEDTQNYTIFLKEFREAINKLGYPFELTIAAPAGITNMRNIEISKVHEYLDYINLMAYDFNGDWSSTTGHNAPLTAPIYDGKAFGDGIDRAANYTPTFYDDYAIQYYIKQGVPAEKMILGMPLYGRSFANAAATENVKGLPGLYNTFDRSISGSQVTDDGHSYQSWPNIKNNILPNMPGNGYTRYWDDKAQVPYLFNPKYSNPAIPTAKTDLITYDDDQSLGIKAEYVKKNRLGGAMFWQLENDKSIWSAIGNVATVMNS